MVKKSIALVVVASAVLGLAIATGRLGTTSHASRPVTAAIAGPARGPCVFLDPQRVNYLVATSDLVVEARVVARPEVVLHPGIATPFSRYHVAINSVVRMRQPFSRATVTVDEVGADPHSVFHPGRYILFLVRADSGAYFVLGGLDGVYIVQDGRVHRHCANYDDPSQPLQATGSGEGMTESAFIALILNWQTPPAAATSTKTSG